MLLLAAVASFRICAIRRDASCLHLPANVHASWQPLLPPASAATAVAPGNCPQPSIGGSPMSRPQQGHQASGCPHSMHACPLWFLMGAVPLSHRAGATRGWGAQAGLGRRSAFVGEAAGLRQQRGQQAARQPSHGKVVASTAGQGKREGRG
jgi:hypothetical protein